MPTLKQVTCSLELGPSNTKLKEYMHRYTDGGVEAFVAVPGNDIPFHVRVTSTGYIAPGLAVYVFHDGQYQCNRNRQRLQMPRPGLEAREYEVDFKLRQKEEKTADGHFVAREWTFSRLHSANADDHATEINPTVARNVGAIEVVVLRCKDGGGPGPARHAATHKSASTQETPREKASSKVASKKASEAGSGAFGGFGMGLFDGGFDGAFEEEPYARWDPRSNLHRLQQRDYGYRNQSNDDKPPGFPRVESFRPVQYQQKHTPPPRHLPEQQNHHGLAYIEEAARQIEAILHVGCEGVKVHASMEREALMYRNNHDVYPGMMRALQRKIGELREYNEEIAALYQSIAACIKNMDEDAYNRAHRYLMTRRLLPPVELELSTPPPTPYNPKSLVGAQERTGLSLWQRQQQQYQRPQYQQPPPAVHAIDQKSKLFADNDLEGVRKWEEELKKDTLQKKNNNDQEDEGKRGNGSDWGANVKKPDIEGDDNGWPYNNADDRKEDAKSKSKSPPQGGTEAWADQGGGADEWEGSQNGEQNGNADVDADGDWNDGNQVDPWSSKSKTKPKWSTKNSAQAGDGAGSIAKPSASRATAPSDLLRPVIKPYWNNWSQGACVSSKPRRPPRPRDAYSYPAPPPPAAIPGQTSSNVQHGISAGRGADYAHRLHRPEYLDTMQRPYAVFTFKYRSRRALEKMMGGKKIETKNVERAVREVKEERLMRLSKDELVAELMKKQSLGGGGGGPASKRADSKVGSKSAALSNKTPSNKNGGWGNDFEVKPSDSVSNVKAWDEVGVGQVDNQTWGGSGGGGNKSKKNEKNNDDAWAADVGDGGHFDGDQLQTTGGRGAKSAEEWKNVEW